MFMIIYSTITTCTTLIGIAGMAFCAYVCSLYNDAKEQITELRCAIKYMQGKEAERKSETNSDTKTE